jgi:hypothetical protein
MCKILFKNDSARLKKEYEDLQESNAHLFDLINDLAKFINKKFEKDLTITMILRTQEEQDEIYKNDPKYKVRKFKSPHQFSHAVDLRSRDFTKDEISAIEDYLNTEYNPTNFYKWTARDHNVGLGDHLHLQYYKVK